MTSKPPSNNSAKSPRNDIVARMLELAEIRNDDVLGKNRFTTDAI
jgi:hypothetical protein